MSILNIKGIEHSIGTWRDIVNVLLELSPHYADTVLPNVGANIYPNGDSEIFFILIGTNRTDLIKVGVGCSTS